MKGYCKKCNKVMDETEFCQGNGFCYDCSAQKDFDLNFDSNIHKKNSKLDKTSNTILDNSQGTINEQFKRLQIVKDNNFHRYEKNVFISAYNEIHRICARIGLSKGLADKIYDYFKTIWNKTDARTKEHRIRTLVPVVIFRCSKLLCYSVDLKSILNSANCTKQEFNQILASTYDLFGSANPYNNILSAIEEVCRKMNMPDIIYQRALIILQLYSSKLMNTTRGVSVSACIGIAVLSLNLRNQFRFYKIAENSNVSASAMSIKIQDVISMYNIKQNLKMKDLDVIIPKIYERLSNRNTGENNPVIKGFSEI